MKSGYARKLWPHRNRPCKLLGVRCRFVRCRSATNLTLCGTALSMSTSWRGSTRAKRAGRISRGQETRASSQGLGGGQLRRTRNSGVDVRGQEGTVRRLRFKPSGRRAEHHGILVERDPHSPAPPPARKAPMVSACLSARRHRRWPAGFVESCGSCSAFGLLDLFGSGVLPI
jgi:hypothetical protein